MPVGYPGWIDSTPVLMYSSSMETRRILIAGDTLFAEMLAQLLATNPSVEVIGVVSGLDECQKILPHQPLDALIYTGKATIDQESLAQILASFPELPVLCADLSANTVQVIVSQHLRVRSSNELLAAIAALPKRS